MTKEDLDNLANVVQLDPEVESQFVYGKLARGEMVPWRVETDKGNTILIVEVKQKKQERTLYVWFVGGEGFVGSGRFVLDTLVEYAKLHNCTAVESLTSPQFARYLKRVGFSTKHCFVKKEIL